MANRLPVRQVQRGQNLTWEWSPGGLVSALAPVLTRSEGVWIGWNGRPGRTSTSFQFEGIENLSVPLRTQEIDDFYNGFSNRTIWPLYHDAVRWPEYHRIWWKPYVEVNRRFAEAAASVAAPKATVWVHDYHFQLVPGMLREMRPDLKIGFFLHIPFPPQELFSQLPWRRQILEGLLGSDVVGFQTRTAAQNFARLARRYTATGGNDRELRHKGRTIVPASFPISIDFQHFDSLARTSAVNARAQHLRRVLGGEGRRIILGVDRLDYTKGIDVRLKAFRELLRSKAVTIEDCVFVQCAVPSREKVVQYADLKRRVEQTVGEINGEFGSVGRVAVHYLHRNLPIEELVALYRLADVMVVTPFRDGMNLIAKEYVASRTENTGVLVLSEFAGAAQELRRALLVNPHDVDGIVSTLERSLRLSQEETRRRMRWLRRVVQKHDVFAWADSFFEALKDG
ncbi:MAG: trehalose-6-phosphate synthase [Candidatus Eisenbacteria bacterium]